MPHFHFSQNTLDLVDWKCTTECMPIYCCDDNENSCNDFCTKNNNKKSFYFNFLIFHFAFCVLRVSVRAMFLFSNWHLPRLLLLAGECAADTPFIRSFSSHFLFLIPVKFITSIKVHGKRNEKFREIKLRNELNVPGRQKKKMRALEKWTETGREREWEREMELVSAWLLLKGILTNTWMNTINFSTLPHK